MPRVIEIPAIEREQRILRIAAYCRVSSNSEDQLHSYAAQIDEYTRKVAAHPGWVLVDIYADEGLTGTRMEKRDDLSRLISDCKKGKIDKVLIKSISRLARNTADSLTILRDLKLIGVSVQSEKENLDTAELTSEMLIMLWSNHAQAESTSISQNMRWSYKKRIQSGEFITCKAPYGYQIVDGKALEAEKDEAGIVRWIFENYLNGMSPEKMSERLNEMGVETPETSAAWRPAAIRYILTNEKYIGDTLAQKKMSTDDFPFRKVPNKGEKDQYYIKNSHPAIISRDVFERAQTLMSVRGPSKGWAPNKYTLSRKIVCSECGATLKRRQSKGGCVVWVCRQHDGNISACTMPRISEDAIHDTFIRMANKLRKHCGMVLEPALAQLEDLQKASRSGNSKLIEVRSKLAVVSDQTHMLNSLRANGLLDDETWQLKSNAIALKRAELQKEQHLLMRNDDQMEMVMGLQGLMDIIQSIEKPLTAFDADLFTEMVQKVTVHSAEKISFHLMGGIKIIETMRIMG